MSQVSTVTLWRQITLDSLRLWCKIDVLFRPQYVDLRGSFQRRALTEHRLGINDCIAITAGMPRLRRIRFTSCPLSYVTTLFDKKLCPRLKELTTERMWIRRATLAGVVKPRDLTLDALRVGDRSALKVVRILGVARLDEGMVLEPKDLGVDICSELTPSDRIFKGGKCKGKRSRSQGGM